MSFTVVSALSKFSAIFSRITRPQNVVKVSSLPANSKFLADMLSKSFTIDEVQRKVGIQ
ncbi:hypothetical protein OAF17_03415 [Akkermansiaceae bacterium]|nr:hypothetical protein [Akkermansiaceae bacterium]MDB4699941.1 hypothetical protein [Akkermansiaceae bacterium]